EEYVRQVLPPLLDPHWFRFVDPLRKSKANPAEKRSLSAHWHRDRRNKLAGGDEGSRTPESGRRLSGGGLESLAQVVEDCRRGQPVLMLAACRCWSVLASRRSPRCQRSGPIECCGSETPLHTHAGSGQ